MIGKFSFEKSDICGAFEYLAGIQNEFIIRSLALAADGCRSLLYLRDDNHGAGAPLVPVQEVSEVDIHYSYYQVPKKLEVLILEFL